MNRAAVVDDLAEKYGVKAVLDFSDTQEDLQKYRGESTWSSDYFDRLEESGKVKLVGLGVNPASEEFHKDLSEALYWLTLRRARILSSAWKEKTAPAMRPH